MTESFWLNVERDIVMQTVRSALERKIPMSCDHREACECHELFLSADTVCHAIQYELQMATSHIAALCHRAPRTELEIKTFLVDVLLQPVLDSIFFGDSAEHRPTVKDVGRLGRAAEGALCRLAVSRYFSDEGNYDDVDGRAFRELCRTMSCSLYTEILGTALFGPRSVPPLTESDVNVLVGGNMSAVPTFDSVPLRADRSDPDWLGYFAVMDPSASSDVRRSITVSSIALHALLPELRRGLDILRDSNSRFSEAGAALRRIERVWGTAIGARYPARDDQWCSRLVQLMSPYCPSQADEPFRYLAPTLGALFRAPLH